LAKHLRELANRQFHGPQQGENPNPGRVGKRLEKFGDRQVCGHVIRI